MESQEVISEKQLEELSAEEFQHKLYAWFRERGLLSDLRAYLRRQMIFLLQETSLGQSLSEAMPRTISPKMQATNFLIAEFLLRQQNHYTLSVFTSEVPFLQTFPEFSESGQIQPRRKRYDRLKIQDVIDILDTIGLSQGTNEGVNILTVYQNNDDALLTCIIRCLSTLTTQKKTENDTFIDLEPVLEKNSPYFLSALQNILIKTKVKGHAFFYLKEQIKSLFETELNNIKLEEENKLKIAIDDKEKEFKSKLIDKEKDAIEKIAESELKFKEYKKKCKQEMKQKQKQLEKLAEQLRAQYREVKSSMEEIQNRTDDLNTKESRLKQIYVQKSEEMSQLKSELQLRHEMLCVKEASIIKLKQDLEKSQNAIHEAASSQEVRNLKEQVSVLKEELEQTKSKIVKPKVTCDKEIQATDTFENVQALKDSLDQVQRENTEIRLRLDAMTQRCDALTSDVPSTIHFRIPNQSEPGEAITIPASRPISRRRLRIDSRQVGGGEESRVIERPEASVSRERGVIRSRDRRDWQRRITRVMHSSSSESSPTDEVVRDARRRLRRLQEETDSLHRSYREFRRRQTENPFPELNSFRGGMTPSCSHERPFGGLTFETSRPRAMFSFQQVDEITQRFHDIGTRDMQNLNTVRFKFSSVNPLKTNVTMPKTSLLSKGRRNSLDDNERKNIATTLEHVINKLESAQTKLDTSLSSSQPEIEPKDDVEQRVNGEMINVESIQTTIDKDKSFIELENENINEQAFIELIETSQNSTKHFITGIKKQDQSIINANNFIVDAFKPEITHETDRNKPATAESRPETVESRLETVEIRLKAAESRLKVAESKSETAESRSETSESRLKTAENKSERRISALEIDKPETIESRPQTAENQSEKPLSALEIDKPETIESRQETSESRPQTAENQSEKPLSALEIDKPETIESKRETIESLYATETKETSRNETIDLNEELEKLKKSENHQIRRETENIHFENFKFRTATNSHTDSLLNNDNKENMATESSNSNTNISSEFVVVSDNGNKNITGILIETVKIKNIESSETHIEKSEEFPVELKEKQNKTYKRAQQTNQENKPIDLIIPAIDKSFTEKIDKLKSSLLEIDDIEKKFNETVATPFFMRDYNLTSIENELYNIQSYKVFDTSNLNDHDSNETEISDSGIPNEQPISGPSHRVNDDIEVIYGTRSELAQLDQWDEKPSASGIATSSVAGEVELSDSSLELNIRPKPSLVDMSISSVEAPISEHLSAGYESHNEDDFWN